MNTSTNNVQTAEIQELSDKELNQVNGGFFWFFIAPVVAKWATIITTGVVAQRASDGGRKVMDKVMG